jgi:hypothetical protein
MVPGIQSVFIPSLQQKLAVITAHSDLSFTTGCTAQAPNVFSKAAFRDTATALFEALPTPSELRQWILIPLGIKCSWSFFCMLSSLCQGDAKGGREESKQDIKRHTQGADPATQTNTAEAEKAALEHKPTETEQTRPPRPPAQTPNANQRQRHKTAKQAGERAPRAGRPRRRRANLGARTR